jgi:hypothetical protein
MKIKEKPKNFDLMINILLQVLEKNTKILEKEKILLKKKKMG